MYYSDGLLGMLPAILRIVNPQRRCGVDRKFGGRTSRTHHEFTAAIRAYSLERAVSAPGAERAFE